MEIHARDVGNKDLLYNKCAVQQQRCQHVEDDTILLKCVVFIYCGCT
jgi:hypothetical protein